MDQLKPAESVVGSAVADLLSREARKGEFEQLPADKVERWRLSNP